MEYPTLFVGGARWLAPAAAHSPEGVTIHEFGHQVFYGMLASNEFEEAHLDEGFNTYATLRTQKTAFGDPSLVVRFFGLPVVFPVRAPTPLAMHERFHRWAQASRSDATDVPSFRQLDGNAVRANAYNRTALLLASAERTFGEKTWAKVLKTYATRWAFKHPTSADFVAVVREVAGEAAARAIAGIWSTAGPVDYAVTSAVRAPRATADGIHGRRRRAHARDPEGRGGRLGVDRRRPAARRGVVAGRGRAALRRRHAGPPPVDRRRALDPLPRHGPEARLRGGRPGPQVPSRREPAQQRTPHGATRPPRRAAGRPACASGRRTSSSSSRCWASRGPREARFRPRPRDARSRLGPRDVEGAPALPRPERGARVRLHASAGVRAPADARQEPVGRAARGGQRGPPHVLHVVYAHAPRRPRRPLEMGRGRDGRTSGAHAFGTAGAPLGLLPHVRALGLGRRVRGAHGASRGPLLRRLRRALRRRARARELRRVRRGRRAFRGPVTAPRSAFARGHPGRVPLPLRGHGHALRARRAAVRVGGRRAPPSPARALPPRGGIHPARRPLRARGAGPGNPESDQRADARPRVRPRTARAHAGARDPLRRPRPPAAPRVAVPRSRLGRQASSATSL